jgi:hypothetical protein
MLSDGVQSRSLPTTSSMTDPQDRYKDYGPYVGKTDPQDRYKDYGPYVGKTDPQDRYKDYVPYVGKTDPQDRYKDYGPYVGKTMGPMCFFNKKHHQFVTITIFDTKKTTNTIKMLSVQLI